MAPSHANKATWSQQECIDVCQTTIGCRAVAWRQTGQSTVAHPACRLKGGAGARWSAVPAHVAAAGAEVDYHMLYKYSVDRSCQYVPWRHEWKKVAYTDGAEKGQSRTDCACNDEIKYVCDFVDEREGTGGVALSEVQVFATVNGAQVPKLPTAQACADAVYALPPTSQGARPDGVTWNKVTQVCHAEYG